MTGELNFTVCAAARWPTLIVTSSKRRQQSPGRKRCVTARRRDLEQSSGQGGVSWLVRMLSIVARFMSVASLGLNRRHTLAKVPALQADFEDLRPAAVPCQLKLGGH